MTYTVSDVVLRALKRMSLVVGGDTPETEDLSEGLAAYNALMFSLEADGLELHDANDDDYTHATQALDDDFPLADKHYEHIVSLVIESTLDVFQKSLTQTLNSSIRTARDALYGDFLTMQEMSIPNGLTQLTYSRRTGGTI